MIVANTINIGRMERCYQRESCKTIIKLLDSYLCLYIVIEDNVAYCVLLQYHISALLMFSS